MAKDYYKILGVDKGASKADIKKAFHKMAHKYHPDKASGDEAKFKEVGEAYRVLSDDAKRAQYDQFGSAGPGGGFGGASGFGGFGGQQAGFDFGDIDLGDIFSAFGGGGFGGGRRQRKGRDIQTEIQIELKDVVFGVTKKISLAKMSECTTCDATGAKPGSGMETCSQCKGAGQIDEIKQSILGKVRMTSVCPTCHGNKQIPKDTCGSCKGAGVEHRKDTIELEIPAGIQTGESIVARGHGEAITGGPSGDLYVRVVVKPHPGIERKGSDLVGRLSIKLGDALLGGEYEIETVDGKQKVKIPAGHPADGFVKLGGLGVQKSGTFRNSRGDFIIKTKIEIPKKLSKQARGAAEILQNEGL